jgi:hypothetical protein
MVHCLAHIFEVDGQIFHDRELKEKPDAALFGRSPREVMQSFGTDWGRKLIHPDIWVRRVENKLVHFNRCLLSDVRFDNEAQMIKRNGGVIWHIERKNNPFAVNTGNESEHGIDDRYIDWVIHNDGDMDQLRAEIANAMAGIKNRLIIEGSDSPQSLRRVPISEVIAEEVDSHAFLSIGCGVTSDGMSFGTGDIKEH